jgi:hypothetical protein
VRCLVVKYKIHIVSIQIRLEKFSKKVQCFCGLCLVFDKTHKDSYEPNFLKYINFNIQPRTGLVTRKRSVFREVFTRQVSDTPFLAYKFL